MMIEKYDLHHKNWDLSQVFIIYNIYSRLNEEKEEDDLYDEEEEQNDSGHSSEEEEEIDVRVNSNRTVISDIEPLVQHVPISTSSSHEDNVIRIRHSDLTLGPVSYCTESPYQTPACIYREYLNKKNDAMGER
jgi:hypothetical protein